MPYRIESTDRIVPAQNPVQTRYRLTAIPPIPATASTARSTAGASLCLML